MKQPHSPKHQSRHQSRDFKTRNPDLIQLNILTPNEQTFYVLVNAHMPIETVTAKSQYCHFTPKSQHRTSLQAVTH